MNSPYHDNILLVGFMGVGKSAVGRHLSKRLGYYYLDTDTLIESTENCSIHDIFKQKDEAYFRRLEKHTALWLEKSVKKSIIATGGGFFQVENLQQIGTIIWLNAPFEFIYDRLSKEEDALQKRPLFQDKSTAKALYQTREEAYAKVSQHHIDVSDKSLSKITDELIEKLNLAL